VTCFLACDLTWSDAKLLCTYRVGARQVRMSLSKAERWLRAGHVTEPCWPSAADESPRRQCEACRQGSCMTMQGCIRTASATRSHSTQLHSPSESGFSLALCLPCTRCTTTHALHDSKITENKPAHVLVVVTGWAAIKLRNTPSTARPQRAGS
jgi:hypothetical protein